MKRKFGHKAALGREYCAGFVDKHGQWNNGFYCPKWGGPEHTYCCGPDRERHCCPNPKDGAKKITGNVSNSVPVVVGVLVGVVVVLAIMMVVVCYFCRCCWAYKRRKRLQGHGQSGCSQPYAVSARPTNYAVNYSACPHNSLYPEFMAPRPNYPLEDPPPYPGEQSLPLEEKLPLRRTEYYLAEEAELAQGAHASSSSSTSAPTRTTSSIPQLHPDDMEPDPLCDLEVEMTNYPDQHQQVYNTDYYSSTEDYQRPSTSRSGYSGGRRSRDVSGRGGSARMQDSGNDMCAYMRDHERRVHDSTEGGSEWDVVYQNSGAAMVQGAMAAR